MASQHHYLKTFSLTRITNNFWNSSVSPLIAFSADIVAERQQIVLDPQSGAEVHKNCLYKKIALNDEIVDFTNVRMTTDNTDDKSGSNVCVKCGHIDAIMDFDLQHFPVSSCLSSSGFWRA